MRKAGWKARSGGSGAAGMVPVPVVASLGELNARLAEADAAEDGPHVEYRAASVGALDGHYARAGDEAYALIRQALTTPGDIIPGHSELLIRLDPLTALRADPGTRHPLRPAQPSPGLLPGHRSRPALRGQTPPSHCVKYLSMSGVLISGT